MSISLTKVLSWYKLIGNSTMFITFFGPNPHDELVIAEKLIFLSAEDRSCLKERLGFIFRRLGVGGVEL